MDYARPELAERLASEYVLGTLRGPARRRFEVLLQAHPTLRASVAAWQERLAPLAVAAPAVEPSPQVWHAIEQRLFAAAGAAAAAPRRWWQQLGLWQGAAGLATVAALALGLVISQPLPVEPPIVIVLNANPDAAGALPSSIKASFVASLSADGRALVLKPIGELPIEASKALELWAVPASGAPRSLGLVSAQQATTVLQTKLLKDTAAFAVSLEPAGGSKTGAPTGPILSVGKLQT
ncbi:anti-sigma factor [Rivibacter subsaxonicus]|uniref:Anti-sigma-K factor RskA n=1 Tax=Rivibacter subsaxonicus TaxID=457575 RepID=A0A4Q7VWN5_9BURK|nr:anti-sigma factor [Rivibacter subsaxonicus]RZU01147.1 anti-sigma-K factor RskA [Rivibacter subsaxonicus]